MNLEQLRAEMTDAAQQSGQAWAGLTAQEALDLIERVDQERDGRRAERARAVAAEEVLAQWQGIAFDALAARDVWREDARRLGRVRALLDDAAGLQVSAGDLREALECDGGYGDGR